METKRDDQDALGHTIGSHRQSRGLTLQNVAKAANVSESLVSQIERGKASPSITTLRRLASALEVPVAALFLESDGDWPRAAGKNGKTELDGQRIIVRGDERKWLKVPKSKVNYQLLTPDHNRQIEFLWIEYIPGAVSRPTPMGHAGEENALCIRGSVVVTIEGEEFVLEEGDSISFDSGRAHQVENRADEPAILISAITPPSF